MNNTKNIVKNCPLLSNVFQYCPLFSSIAQYHSSDYFSSLVAISGKSIRLLWLLGVCTSGTVTFDSCCQIIAIHYSLSVTCYLVLAICYFLYVAYFLTLFIGNLLLLAITHLLGVLCLVIFELKYK